ncbi:ATP-binding cassette domain-containing protein [Curtobacterium sp. VKM Ac-1393]|uniref:ATP-binding cassette domain-containing protein n=1 Tax=Curtobacterium sp. VKM Ac-1393 TaxID=2783814 RepID=UPI00188B758D|nr:ATP-binding cassette domain-containing protein [Curtobacterium sp. VKM Ac-1393]MBF4609250.1 ATP-binding cassette domain-containing protein [Curtobacterium sp. VKM Ac-1393]
MAVEIDELAFGYRRDHQVISGLSTVFPSGASVLLGPNGAGKSTLLGLIADTLRPPAGMIRVEGLGSPSDRGNRRRYRRGVAWLPQLSGAFPGLTTREHVAYCGWLKGLSRSDAWDRATAALTAVDLAARADVRATTLSGGQIRRLGVAGALVSGAQWILLDEPTAGLDPAQRSRFAQVMQNLPTEVSVIVSTHQTEDVAATYDHVTVLVDGHVPFSGSVDAFTEPFETLAPADAITASYARFTNEDD